MHWATIAHIIWQLLYWPGGIILGNLLASVIWSSIFEWRIGAHRRKTDKAVDYKLAHQNEHIKGMLDTHHASVKEMIKNGKPESESVSVQSFSGLPGT